MQLVNKIIQKLFLLLLLLLCLSACNKSYFTIAHPQQPREQAFQDILPLVENSYSVSGLALSDTIYQEVPFYAAMLNAPQICSDTNKFDAAKTPRLQHISPIVPADTLPVATPLIPKVSKENNAALALGVISFLFPLLAIILAPIGLFKAAKAKRQIAKNPELYTGSTQVKIALFLNILSLIIFVVLMIYIYNFALSIIQLSL